MQCDQTVMNNTLKSLGGDCAKYHATAIAWNDGARHVYDTSSGPIVSAFSNNMTDARIVSEDVGKVLPFVRPPNLKEHLGVTSCDEVDVIVDGEQTNLQSFLENVHEHVKYRGMEKVDAKIQPNHPCVVRVQNVAIPLSKGEKQAKISPAHYSYQTFDETNPRNLLFAFTPTGYSVHTDKPGINKLLSHSVAADGTVNSHWFVAEPTNYKVGKAQVADKDPKDLSPKKARSVKIGIKGMGPRNNCFITVAMPLKQKPRRGVIYSPLSGDDDDDDDAAPVYRSLSAAPPEVGKASAARLSVDEEVYGTVDSFDEACERPENEPIVITIMLFNTIEGTQDSGKLTFSKQDLACMVADMEEIYDLCQHRCDIHQLPVMLQKYKKEDMAVIAEKMKVDPQPPIVPKNPFIPSKTAMVDVYGDAWSNLFGDKN